MSIDAPASSELQPQVLGHPLALYEHAVLHVLVSVADKHWSLLFGFVELLPREVPAPLHDGVIMGPRLTKTNARVFVDHVPISAHRALDWYEDAREGRIVRPQPDGSLPKPTDEDAVLCEPLSWSEEPPWPGYVLAARLPFLSGWHKRPRIHHLVPSENAWSFTPSEMETLDDFVDEQFGFRRASWPALASSIHLVAPNPYFRSFHEWLRDDDIGTETIDVAIEPRTRVDVPPLELRLEEHRPTGIGAATTLAVDAQRRPALMTARFHETSSEISLATGGLLHVRERSGFMREFHMAMDVGGTVRRVPVSAPDGNVIETYDVHVARSFTHRSQETSNPAGATASLANMLDYREVRALAERLEQHWFGGNPAAAQTFVRERIAKARDQLLIADQYLGGIEIQRYALAVALAGVPVRLLTTCEAFKTFGPADLIALIANRRTSDPTLGEIDLRVLNKGQLHDRFLRIDNRLYTLGTSLNSLGDQAHLILRIPDPEPVFQELERLWKDAALLADVAAKQP